MACFLTSNFHGLNVAIVFAVMEEKTGISVTALDEPVGMLQNREETKLLLYNYLFKFDI